MLLEGERQSVQQLEGTKSRGMKANYWWLCSVDTCLRLCWGERQSCESLPALPLPRPMAFPLRPTVAWLISDFHSRASLSLALKYRLVLQPVALSYLTPI